MGQIPAGKSGRVLAKQQKWKWNWATNELEMEASGSSIPVATHRGIELHSGQSAWLRNVNALQYVEGSSSGRGAYSRHLKSMEPNSLNKLIGQPLLKQPLSQLHLCHPLQGGDEEKPASTTDPTAAAAAAAAATSAVPNSSESLAPGLASLMQSSKPDQKTTLDPDGKRLQVCVSEFELSFSQSDLHIL